jgi:PAS domain S-box-containing protein
MVEPPVPEDEERRVARLRALGILDTPPEERFDRLTRLAAALFHVPIALVSLVDVNRQWFKSCVGLDGSETERSVSFCGHALSRRDALVIEDAHLDPRFADNPFVTGDPWVRFYAGHPLLNEHGSAVGTLCIIDPEPRPFSDDDRRALADLAHLVENELNSVELAQAMEALAASEARVKGILDSVAEAVATFGPDGRVLSFNPAGEKMFGCKADELVGKRITDIVMEDDVQIVLDLLSQRASSPIGEEVHVEVRGLRNDGAHFEMEVSASELAGSDGQVFIAVARDVSEFSALQRRHRLILDAAGDGIIGVDTDGFVTFANPAAATMLGLSTGELVGVALHHAMHHTKRDGSPYPWEESPTYRTMQEGERHRVEAELFFRIDGTPFEVQYTCSPTITDGRVTGAVIVFSDITARREVELLKDQFVSVVSHELRTPLTSIQGSLGLVAGGVLGDLPDEPREMVEVALANTQRLVRLVNDILDLERISSGTLELDTAPCDAAVIARDAALAIAGAADAAGVPVEVDVASAELVADDDRLVQALTNLIGNAVKFSPAGTPVLVGSEVDDETVTFTVADRGRGIPIEKLESVFDRFQQVDASDRREKGGTGLGLPITRSIARQHGGDVTVTSALGAGSTFRLTVPRRPS